MGVRFRINLADEKIFRAAHEAFSQGRRTADRAQFCGSAVRAIRGFTRHQSALDAVVRFVEETDRALIQITKEEAGRFQLSRAQGEIFEEARHQAAREAINLHKTNVEELVKLGRFLSERWADWNGDGRPLIAGGYKDLLAELVRMTMLVGGHSFSDMRDRIGKQGGWLKPILDVIWPDWVQEEKDRVRRTLKARTAEPKTYDLRAEEIDAFVDFIETRNLEGLFWRLRSFEEHAFRGNDFALEGMKADLQGMAVAVEHVARALGGTDVQLYEMFKQLWRVPEVLALLRRNDVAGYARQRALLQDWPALKKNIEELRVQSQAGDIVADLVMTYRIRGGLHYVLPEDNQFELERLLVSVMRAAALTFTEVQRWGSSTPGSADLA